MPQDTPLTKSKYHDLILGLVIAVVSFIAAVGSVTWALGSSSSEVKRDMFYLGVTQETHSVQINTHSQDIQALRERAIRFEVWQKATTELLLEIRGELRRSRGVD